MKTRIVLILITLLCAAVASVQSALAAIIMVTNTNDSGPGSLREALATANDGDTIDATGVSGTILLTSGALEIFNGVTINGPGAGTLAVNGNGSSRVFENFAPVGDATISGFTITNGFSDYGGGILNGGSQNFCCWTLTVSNCTISGNSADYGGGIYNSAGLTITNSTVSGNSASYGGGIYNVGGGVTISNSTLSGNVASVVGGGAHNNPNYSEFLPGLLSVTNSTISGNSAPGNGGGIFNNGCAGYARCAYLTLGSTVLNAGASGGTIFNVGHVTSIGYNLASDGGGGVLTGSGDQINTDPMLGPLQDNGGATFTHALLPGSPAINAGDPSFTPPPFFDQRGPGFDRVVNGRIDIGSFELQASTPTPTPTATATATATATPTATATVRPTATPRFMPTPRPRPIPHPRP